MPRVPGKIPLIVGAGAGHTIGVRGKPTDELTLYAAQVSRSKIEPGGLCGLSCDSER